MNSEILSIIKFIYLGKGQIINKLNWNDSFIQIHDLDINIIKYYIFI